jgi:tRNA threonylcarbamoyladenosine biosynthesis protein TsaB
MTRLLAIETSSEACSVALRVDGRLYESHEHAPLRHAELLLPAVERLLADAGVALRDLDAIAFGRGPGSFTSLRIGIGVVQGLAWAARLPVIPISSQAAVAQEALGTCPMRKRPRQRKIRVAVDARMRSVHRGFAPGPGGLVQPVAKRSSRRPPSWPRRRRPSPRATASPASRNSRRCAGPRLPAFPTWGRAPR